MSEYNNIEDFLIELKNKMKGEMPRIRKEIILYEEKRRKGQLTANHTPSPQFEG